MTGLHAAAELGVAASAFTHMHATRLRHAALHYLSLAVSLSQPHVHRYCLPDYRSHMCIVFFQPTHRFHTIASQKLARQ